MFSCSRLACGVGSLCLGSSKVLGCLFAMLHLTGPWLVEHSLQTSPVLIGDCIGQVLRNGVAPCSSGGASKTQQVQPPLFPASAHVHDPRHSTSSNPRMFTLRFVVFDDSNVNKRKISLACQRYATSEHFCPCVVCCQSDGHRCDMDVVI